MDTAVRAMPSDPARSAAPVSGGRSRKTRLITDSTPTSAERAKAFEQERDYAEDAGAATNGEVERGDQGQRQDFCNWSDQLGKG